MFCPAGVCETIHDEVKPADRSNCLHGKTCQRKCPFDNIRWTAPKGGGPRYKRMYEDKAAGEASAASPVFITVSPCPS